MTKHIDYIDYDERQKRTAACLRALGINPSQIPAKKSITIEHEIGASSAVIRWHGFDLIPVERAGQMLAWTRGVGERPSWVPSEEQP